MSEELKEDLIELGLQRYVSALFNAGYDNWDVISDMTESDFDALNIRLGDRRKLQREIARRQFWPENSPLPTSDELREFTLSLHENTAEEIKNGYFHQRVAETIEYDNISPDTAGSPSRAESELHFQDEGPGSVAETPESSDTIPSLELDRQVNGYDTTEGNAPNHVSIADMDFDDDDTPRGAESRAPLLE